MRILFAGAECAPFVKTGGLGDVLGALPNELAERGDDVGVVLPLYQDIPDKYRQKMQYQGNFIVPVGWRNQYCGIFTYKHHGVTYFFIDNEYYFKRPGIYGYYDDGERFAYFQQAVIMMMERFNFIPSILHCNDYHTAFIPFLLHEKWGFVDAYRGIKTVLTIHNLEFQGKYNAKTLPGFFNMGYDWFDSGIVRQSGDVNWMKTGILYADRVTTVSPSYAREIQTPEFGQGLDGILRMCSHKVTGILNGIDFKRYNPETDPDIKADYNVRKLRKKVQNKIALQKELGLKRAAHIPLIGMVTRLTAQKGCQLLVDELDNILKFNVQVAILGNGDPFYEHALSEIAKRHPGKMSLTLAFDTKLAQRIYAGADSFLMPSAFEPCGLSQLIALHYGTLPVVHQIGGLADTVWVYDKTKNEGTGFGFKEFSGYQMVQAIKNMLAAYGEKDIWFKMQRTAMKSDFSWHKSASDYQWMYGELVD
ncbi:glycogen synthase GlgA [Lactobacillus kefiranofaciens subsp. kefirgranum]|uniref:glycogen synthase GlgA n=1 Tax=Lactobacillus kefiranofaciens TaxID=267818 RepID=UPI0006D21A64|nr:glycogen synthase GlgA [Lactobacillus kefiranofaciens]KRL28924.1 glycogen synthase [Lactobacillus kefiranofaciens subsp. kefirgranum DSM 10550 = JCM 8572]MCP9330756.1 glycogen synthase GlgA [Lactobacillus kefiranofaciens]PAK97668.1 starch synthase [Lactobacillus kefiranofaciens]URW70493.1 glycogen synthase GlgA [Lactobacillus kefiranofaciens subsp. kefirgranum]URW72436.1 glycogen synthase GlgA [Lactobacillus kefiranofaciens subsp. kefirgranum]